MYRSKLIALILLISFVCNFCLVGPAPAAAADGGDAPQSTPFPRITNVYPNYWDLNGDGDDKTITVEGENFIPGKTSVVLEAVTQYVYASAVHVDDSGRFLTFKLVFSDKNFLAGKDYAPVNLRVTVDDSRQARVDNGFVFLKDVNIRPTDITGIEPNSGSTTGGTEVTIRGNYFLQSIDENGQPKPPEVWFGDHHDSRNKAATVTVKNATEIVATSPRKDRTESVEIYVKNLNQETPTRSELLRFEYFAEGEQISILNITPDRGTMSGGTTVAIRGINFPTQRGQYENEQAPPGQDNPYKLDGEYENVTVLIGDVAAKIVDIYEDKNTPPDEKGNKVHVIEAVTSQSSLAGKQDVRVIVDWAEGVKNGRTEAAVLRGGFTYYEPATNPEISWVVNTTTNTPEGPIRGGHMIRIRGKGFVTPVEVYFGKAQASVRNITGVNGEEQEILVVLPPIDRNDTIGPVDVRVVNMSSDPNNPPTGEYTLKGGFAYKRTGIRITSITPDSIFDNEASKPLDITGVNFDEDEGNTVISLGHWNFDKNVAEVDPAYPNNYIITDFDHYSISEAVPLKIIRIEDNGRLILAAGPEKPTAGKKDLIIENSYGIVIVPDVFEVIRYDVEPVIDWVVTPESVNESVNGAVYKSPEGPAAGHTPFVILGKNFQSRSKVYIDGNEALNVRVESSSRISAVSPPMSPDGTPGWRDVKVVSPYGKEAVLQGDPGAEEGRKGFLYYSEPKITKADPDFGSTGGGNIITITGEQFFTGALVEFGFLTDQVDKDGKKIFASVTQHVYEMKLVDNKTIKIRLPEVLDTASLEKQWKEKGLIQDTIDQYKGYLNKDEFEVQVLVRNADGAYAVWEPFTLLAPKQEPQITAVSPSVSTTAGGKQVVIRGENFKDPMVHFGWEPAKIISSTAQEIIVIAPPQQAGTVKITVTSREDGATAVWEKGFIYLDPDNLRKIEQVVPDNGPAGTKITIITDDPEGFRSGAEVWIGGKQAPTLEVNHSYIVAETPVGDQVGPVDVVVRNPDGVTYLLEKGFTYRVPDSYPTITSVNPLRIPVTGNVVVTIKGTDFRKDPVVYFGSEPATVLDFAATELIVLAPEFPLKVPGKVYVTVVNRDGGVAQYGQQIEYVLPESEPVIDRITPAQGPAAGGNVVVIEGDGFATKTDVDVVVYFGGTQAEVQTKNYDRLEVKVPAGSPGPVHVTVSNIKRTDGSVSGSVTAKNAYTYLASKPEILTVAPNQGTYQGGTLVTITGRDFTVGAAVYIDEWAGLNVQVLNPETITFVTPAVPLAQLPELKWWDVKVINADGQVAIKKGAFRYLVPESSPKITGIEPAAGPTTGGLPVRITGTDFRKDAKVVVGGKDALEVQVINENTIIARIPPYTLEAGKSEAIVGVVVVNYDGATSNEVKFTYKAPRSFPEIDGIAPKEGPSSGNTIVIISGIGFKEGARVWFGLQEAPYVKYVNYDTLEVTTPPSTPGTVDVLVLNPDMGQAVLANAYRYVASKPRVDDIVPDEGSYRGGTVVTITGQDFSRDVKVFIGNWPAEVVREQSTAERIVIKTPPAGGVAGGNPDYIGWHDVKIVNGDGVEIIVANGFRYLYPETNPEIVSVDPEEGSTEGGLLITIKGKDFRDRARVVIGGKEAEVLYISDDPANSVIVARIPPHSPGAKELVVINYDGAASKPVQFTYQVPRSFPEIMAVEPSEGLTVGGTEVTITGIGFKSGARIWFGINEVPKEQVQAIDYQTIKVTTPPGTVGTVDVLLQNPDWGQAVLPNGFTYVAPAGILIDRIEPDRGHAKGGTVITITGGPFLDGATVTIGGIPVPHVEVRNIRTIVAETPKFDLRYEQEAVVDVTVTNPDGMSATKVGGFTYFKTAPEHPPTWVETERKDRETIEIKWDPVEFANYYEIWVSNTRNGRYRFLAQTDRTVYYATGLDYNTTYYFQVRAVNELGVSDFSYYESARTGSGRQQETNLVPENIIMETANGNATATIATANALAYTGYRIDFTQAAYRNAARKAVRISQKALTQAYLPITIEAPGISLSVPGNSIFLGLLTGEEDYAEIIITDLGQQVAERAMRELPRGSRIISPVYEVGWQILKGTASTPQNTFHGQVQLTMNYDVSITPGKQVSLYTYNPTTGKWVNTGAANNTNAPQLTLGITNGGRFMLVEH